MNGKKLFEKYYARLAIEGIFKSLLCGIFVAFTVAFLLALGLWFAEIKVLWFCLGAIAFVTAVTTPLFYFMRFRPDTKAIARRLDRLGLEERLITMTELEGDESYIATRQREDAKIKLSSVNKKMIKLFIPIPIIVATCISFVVGSATVTTATLFDYGVLDREIFEPEVEEVWCFVSYVMFGEGEIIGGEADQEVLYGQDAVTVTAVAADGYEFFAWDDGNQDPTRTELAVTEDLVITALFMELPDNAAPEGEGENDDTSDEPSDQESQQPSQPSPGQQGNNNGQYDEHNMIIDGETYYRPLFGQYYEEVIEELIANSDKYTEEEKAVIEGYFETIE